MEVEEKAAPRVELPKPGAITARVARVAPSVVAKAGVGQHRVGVGPSGVGAERLAPVGRRVRPPSVPAITRRPTAETIGLT